jgi:hypothetical protein
VMFAAMKDLPSEPSKGEQRMFGEFNIGDLVVDELKFESNVQVLVDQRCAYEVNGMKCRQKDCVRIHKTSNMEEKIELEALLHPEPRPINPKVLFKIVVRLPDGSFVKHGTCLSGTYGFYSARHVFYGTTSDLIRPLSDFFLLDHEGLRHAIDPRTLCAPRDEQLNPGQCSDFIKFRTVDVAFNVKCQQTRVSFRNWNGEDREVRNLRYVDGFEFPVVSDGRVTVIDRKTGMCRYTCNSVESDSGCPVFDSHGHCIGIHRGYIGTVNENVFILVYPESLVSWFVQTEPKNL